MIDDATLAEWEQIAGCEPGAGFNLHPMLLAAIAEIRRLREMNDAQAHDLETAYTRNAENLAALCSAEADLAAHQAVVRELAEALESAIAGRLWIDAARKALARPLVQSAREDRDAS